jgi:hypothetical protein
MYPQEQTPKMGSFCAGHLDAARQKKKNASAIPKSNPICSIYVIL